MHFEKIEEKSPEAYIFSEMPKGGGALPEAEGANISENRKTKLIREAKTFGEVYRALREIAANEPYGGVNNFYAEGEEKIIRSIENGLGSFSLKDVSPRYGLQKKVMELLSAGKEDFGARKFFKKVFH